MYTGRKGKPELVDKEVIVWQCTQCQSWSRKEFVSSENPTCPLCGSEMREETKTIPTQVEQE